jgi:hypothetical protein
VTRSFFAFAFAVAAMAPDFAVADEPDEPDEPGPPLDPGVDAPPIAVEPPPPVMHPSASANATPRTFNDPFELPPEAYDRRGNLKRKLVTPDGYDAPPPPYIAGTRPHRGMWLGGTIGIGAAWIGSVSTSLLAYSFSGGFLWYSSDDLDETYLLGAIPVVGPFIEAGSQAASDNFKWVDGVLVGLGVAQIACGAVLIAGLSTEQELWILDSKQLHSPRINLHLSPTLNGLSGTF